MTNEELIEQVYAAYNRQDTDALLALVSEDVDWPDGQARLHGKQELRTYWTRQWAETRTRDEVLEIATPMPNRSIVRIGQVVRFSPAQPRRGTASARASSFTASAANCGSATARARRTSSAPEAWW